MSRTIEDVRVYERFSGLWKISETMEDVRDYEGCTMEDTWENGGYPGPWKMSELWRMSATMEDGWDYGGCPDYGGCLEMWTKSIDVYEGYADYGNVRTMVHRVCDGRSMAFMALGEETTITLTYVTE